MRPAAVRNDRTLWTELTSLRFLNGAPGALLLGAVGEQDHLATALGHIAVRRRVPPDAARRCNVQAAQSIPARQQQTKFPP